MQRIFIRALLLVVAAPAFAQSSNSGEPGTPGYQRGEIQSGVATGSTGATTAVRPGAAAPAVGPDGSASSGEPGTAGYARGEARSGINPSSPLGGAGDAGAPRPR
jgi:hypothetical protein